MLPISSLYNLDIHQAGHQTSDRPNTHSVQQYPTCSAPLTVKYYAQAQPLVPAETATIVAGVTNQNGQTLMVGPDICVVQPQTGHSHASQCWQDGTKDKHEPEPPPLGTSPDSMSRPAQPTIAPSTISPLVITPPNAPTPDNPECLTGLNELKAGQPLLQAYTTAYKTIAMFEDYSQQALALKTSSDKPLSIYIDHPRALQYGPHYQPTAIFVDSLASTNPDIIAHEMGHAILDSYHSYATSNTFTASAHEAFADVTSLLTSLQSPHVRADLVNQQRLGKQHNLASVLGEGYLLPEQQVHHSVQDDQGIRNLAVATASTPERQSEPCHTASKRFSSAFYHCLLGVWKQQTELQPGQDSPDSLITAVELVGRDFATALYLLPKQPYITQTNLATAMLEANSCNCAGQQVSIYRHCFTNAGLVDQETTYQRNTHLPACSNPTSLTYQQVLAAQEA